MLRYTLALSALAALTPAHASSPQSINGGSGMGILNTSEIMATGDHALSLGAGITSRGTPLGSGQTLTPSLNMGFGDMGEVFLSVPHTTFDPDGGSSVSGVGDPRLGLKLGITQPEGNGFASAVSLFGTLGVADEDDGIASGEGNYGVELHLSNWHDGGAVHFNIGYEESDSMVSTGLIEPHAKVTAALGVEQALSSTTTLFAQSSAYIDRDANDDKNLLVALGLHYAPSRNLGLQFGYGRGVPDDRSEPESLLFAGVSWSPNSRRPSRYVDYNDPERVESIEGQQQQLDHRVTNLDTRVDNIGQRVEHIEQSTSVDAGDAFPAHARIEVVKVSSNPTVINRIMDQLKQANANIVNVRELSNTSEETTWIHYRTGFSEAAITLGHRLDGNQIVVNRPLPPGIDIQLLIGDTLGAP
ncbi:MAG: transporter [Gammaproteobacteria bacterium]|nr:transporter [Gammaproteobacteria bacterium]MCW8841719.1 transporter [Gammaproteobacteria bacterium]MCW8927285.1 transporter [Gammaproteobacteria bacterium]MCW8959617.1 transporter [Gammaproteobacteria bacterium]MCW8973905.1 transporter [Gammaproteobacteria bacterium]